MNDNSSEDTLDQRIHAAIGRDGVPFDFHRWKELHRREIEQFQSGKDDPGPRWVDASARRQIMIRTLKIAAAAVIFLGICLGVPFLNRVDDPGAALAQIVDQIDRAQTITWKITFYNHVTSKDGLRRWVETETREMAYKAPGLYREILPPTRHGQIEHTCITDAVNLKSLSLVPQERRATLSELAVTTFDRRGPFAGAVEHMNKPDLEWVGTQTTPNGEVNIFRRAFKRRPDNEDWSYDFWVDAKTKRLIAVQAPGADIYDPATDPARRNEVEKEWSTQSFACYVQHDINFEAELDDSLFSLVPPAGYAVRNEQRAQVTEAEMIAYLGAMADYNGQTFPDQPYSIESDRLNEIYDKPKADRTPAERKLLDIVDRCKMAGLNMMPTAHFIQDHTVADSFRYLGKGVKLGDAERIVCWYRLKGGHTYRVVYGDLSVGQVSGEELPLPVEP